MTVLFTERRSVLSTSNTKLAWSHSDSFTDSDLQATQYNHSLVHWPLRSCTGAAMVKGLVLGHLRSFPITDCDKSVLCYVHHLLCLPFGAGQIVYDFFAKTSCLWTLTERVVRLSQNSLAKSQFVKRKPWANVLWLKTCLIKVQQETSINHHYIWFWDKMWTNRIASQNALLLYVRDWFGFGDKNPKNCKIAF